MEISVYVCSLRSELCLAMPMAMTMPMAMSMTM